MSSPEFEIRPSVLSGETADVYFQRTLDILRGEGINPTVSMEFFPIRPGILCGMEEVKVLLHKILPEEQVEVWALPEGDPVGAKEVTLRIKARYAPLGLYETAIRGILSSCTGWATAAHECVEAAGGRPDDGGIPIISFGAHHIHPNVAGNMDYAAIIGGCVSCTTVMGAKLAGISPTGAMPHALTLIMGDTTRAIQALEKHLPPEVPRIALVDTLRDEADEAISIAKTLKDRLKGIRLDTLSERGGVTPDLVKEVRARLDMANFQHVDIWVSGGFTPERIRQFRDSNAPIVGLGVGSYISSAAPNDFTGDIKEVETRPIARRGRIPGITENARLERIL